MADGFTEFEIGLKARADVSQAEGEYDRLFAELKAKIAEALRGEGASPEFIEKFKAGLDEIRSKLDVSGQRDDFSALNAEVEQLVGSLREAATAEAQRIEQQKLGMQTALAEKDAQEAALALQRQRREEDQLAAEIEEMAARKRIAAIVEERELREAAALGRQMSAEQRIEREVRAQGAYSPAEEVARLRQLEEGTRRVAEAKRGLGANAGMAALEVSRLFEDLQYGIGGALNNIPMLLQMLGLGAGLAGVVSIASVALVQLWKHFDGSSEAARKTDEAKAGTDRLRKALEEAAEASSKAFKADLDKYLQSVTASADQWERNKNNINEALQYQNALAAAELRAAQARLEVERQGKLGIAATAEEREGINADFDVRKARLSQEGQAVAMQRALDAQALMQGTLRGRINDSEANKASAQGTLKGFQDDIAAATSSPVGQLSDQARSLRTLESLRQQIRAAEVVLAAKIKEAEENPESGPGRDMQQQRLEDEQAKINELYRKRDEEALAEPSNRAKIARGEVTFNEASSNFEKVPSMQQALIELQSRLKNDRDGIGQAEPEIKKIEEQTVKLKAELRDLADREVLLKKEQIAFQEESKAADAKQATDARLREQQAAEDQEKKERERRALQMENDAREETDPVAAARLRGKAAMARLPKDASDEAKRRVQLDYDAGVKAAEEDQNDEAWGIGQALRRWAERGEKGPRGERSLNAEVLERMAALLEDGTTEEELGRVASALERFGAGIAQNQENLKAEARNIWRRIETLESQLKYGGRR